MIKFINDRKGKYQSCEMKIVKNRIGCADFNIDLDINSYGKDKKESYENIIKAIDITINFLNEAKKYKIEEIKESK